MLKVFIPLLILSFVSEIIISPNSTIKESGDSIVQDSCPPYHEESGKTLLRFLTSDRYKDNRQEAGIRLTEDINPQNVVLIDDRGHVSVCKKLNKQFQWPRDYYEISYFKIDDQYFVVRALNVIQPEEEGEINIHSGNSFMHVLDNDLNRIGYFLY